MIAETRNIMKPRLKLIILVLVLSCVLVLITVSYQMVASWDKDSTSGYLPSDASSTDSSQHVVIKLNQMGVPSNSSFNITQGESTQINIFLASLSNTDEFNVPLYLSIGSFENQRLSKIIILPPAPCPTPLWSDHSDYEGSDSPFKANFSTNPTILKPGANKTVILTITALDDTPPGEYTMLLATGNSEQTGLGGATFQLSVSPKQ
jgi:hypothetical protein